ncbi:ABC transporter ATP-binding protein [Paenibacillus sambharensis]|uniref:ABC transporter ATP-binding protein n=1 Tax=Paenibacillus sambharensis TaxID=1803190 RepID=A0A2W1LJT9_9BACL|nr:ABC transporter ATP-binding protein [Paenibacillus sambharensis]PZD94814.1 ABC transporter ATP-binding protein [Paenibacillus sambharensis]
MLEIDKLTWSRSGSSFRLHIPRLAVGKGITLLAGRNGAGKSSLMHLLGTAVMPDQGKISYGGRTTDRDLASVRASIGFVPTSVSLYEEMTVQKLLHYLSELKGGLSPSQLEGHLERFRLTVYRKRKIKTLPQGIRQRIVLAQAWLGSPEYLFLDEPLNALDSLERLSFIRQLSIEGRSRTIMVSTHELNEWEAWANRLIWLDNGMIRFHGTLTAWTSNLPASVYEGSVTPAQLKALPEEQIIYIRADGHSFRVRVMAAEAPLFAFEKQLPTLEDAYFIRSRLQETARIS